MGDRERDALLHEHYAPYREAAREAVAEIAQGGRTVVHVSVHTFTPVLRGRERQADVGLLYDPSRAPERALGLAWQEALRRSDGALRVRRNYPYRGTADGLATSLRREWPPDAYLGLELEVNQHHVLAREPSWSSLRARICDTLAQALPACADAGGIETRRERK
jgi:predicted N-formylglutamate amidohydrolase